MKTHILLAILSAGLTAGPGMVHGQTSTPVAVERVPTTIYRQVLPDGRIVYSDKAPKGARVDHTITVEPPIKGNLWTTESGTRPVVPQQSERTPVQKVGSVPNPGRSKTRDEATSDVIRAEMLLEDARRRQLANAEPTAEERAGASADGARLGDAYGKRQEALAREVADAEAMLKKAVAERNALR